MTHNGKTSETNKAGGQASSFVNVQVHDRCLTPVVFSDVTPEYTAVCPYCDEDLFSIEITTAEHSNTTDTKLVTEIHSVIISEEQKTVSASMVLNRDAMANYFGIDMNDGKAVLDVVSHRLEETLFSEKHPGEHRSWYCTAVRSFLTDIGVSSSKVPHEKLGDYCLDVILELVKSTNPNLQQ